MKREPSPRLFLCMALLVVSSLLAFPRNLLASTPVLFDGPFNYATGSNPTSIVAADFNKDGKLDLAVASFGIVSILLGNGDGTFAPAVNYTAGGDASHLAAADFNGDGAVDLAVTNSSDNTVSVLLNNGNGTFLTPVKYGTGGGDPVGIVAGDFNGDGKPDLAIVNAGTPLVCQPIYCFAPPCPCLPASPDFANNTVGVLLGNGNGTFQSAVSYALPFQGTALTAADLNNDGALDLAVSSDFGGVSGVSLLMGIGNGSFQSAVSSGIGGASVSQLLSADLNGDKIADLVVADSNGITVQLGLGNAQFQQGASYAVNQASAVVAGDFNGDGIVDLAVVQDTVTNLYLFLGNGDGTFSPAVTYTVGTRSHGVVAGDFDGNSGLDLATANYSTNNASILLNKWSRLVTPSAAIFSGVQLNKASAPQTFSLTNSTAATVTVTSLSLAGTDSGMFGVSPGGSNPCPSLAPTLAPGSSCTIQVVFTPTSFYTKNATLVVTSDHPVMPTVSIPLSGQADPYQLGMLWTGKGSGSILLNPGDASYTSGPSYRSYYSTGDILTLIATANAGSVFAGWSGCDSVSSNACTVTMNGSRYVTAGFNLTCLYNSQCGSGYFCSKPAGACGGTGTCVKNSGGVCIQVMLPVCGCDGRTYSNSCEAMSAGVSVAYNGECGSVFSCVNSPYLNALDGGVLELWNTPCSEVFTANMSKYVALSDAILPAIVVTAGTLDLRGVVLQ